MGLGLRYSPLNYNAATNSFSFGGAGIGGFHTIHPFVGKEVYLVTTKSSTSNLYYDRLRNYHGISDGDIFTTLASAYNATKASRNDVIYVTPGAYDIGAAQTWAHAQKHLIGVGGPNPGGDWSEPNCVIYTDTAAVGSTITVTGQNCSFGNITFSNYANNAGNLAAFTVNKYGCYFKNCAFQGLMTTNQCSTVAAASLYIGGDGMYPIFEDCIIGQNVWGIRTGANQGVLRFTGTARPNGGWFRRCMFKSHSKTATCAMVAIPAATSTGRDWIYEDCIFQNFADDGTSLNQCFYSIGSSVQKHSQLLHNCSAFGIDEWQDANDDVVIATMPITGVGGGLHREPTGTAGN